MEAQAGLEIRTDGELRGFLYMKNQFFRNIGEIKYIDEPRMICYDEHERGAADRRLAQDVS